MSCGCCDDPPCTVYMQKATRGIFGRKCAWRGNGTDNYYRTLSNVRTPDGGDLSNWSYTIDSTNGGIKLGDIHCDDGFDKSDFTYTDFSGASHTVPRQGCVWPASDINDGFPCHAGPNFPATTTTETSMVTGNWTISISSLITDSDLDDGVSAGVAGLSYDAWSEANPTSYEGSYKRMDDNAIGEYIQQSKYRVNHYPTGTCYLKAWLVVAVFDPDTGSFTWSSDLTPYEWTGTGRPCLPIPESPWNDSDNIIYGDAIEVDIPTEFDQYYVVKVKKYSCVNGYEPPDDPENPNNLDWPFVNGFPGAVVEAP